MLKSGAGVINSLRRSHSKANLFGLNKSSLTLMLKEIGCSESYRSSQILQNVYSKGILKFGDMTHIPLDLRKKLDEVITIGTLDTAVQQVSTDGTVKRGYRLQDGQLIESVLMPYKDGRYTACISSQAGCGMGCVFCATGQMGFGRQLSETEIFEQAAAFSCELKAKGKRLSNIVMMGMGEPLNNYQNVLAAVGRMHVDLGIGWRHITISTVGIAPRIRKLADDNPQISLAVSLHQSSDSKRSQLMPVNSRYNISELMEACRYHIDKTHRRLSFEWALISNETDTAEAAHDLGNLIQGMLCHVNLIPLNVTAAYDGQPATTDAVNAFIRILAKYGITATARVRRGIDIDAGCGQLKSLVQKRTSRTCTDRS